MKLDPLAEEFGAAQNRRYSPVKISTVNIEADELRPTCSEGEFFIGHRCAGLAIFTSRNALNHCTCAANFRGRRERGGRVHGLRSRQGRQRNTTAENICIRLVIELRAPRLSDSQIDKGVSDIKLPINEHRKHDEFGNWHDYAAAFICTGLTPVIMASRPRKPTVEPTSKSAMNGQTTPERVRRSKAV